MTGPGCSGDCALRRTADSASADPSRRDFVSRAVLASVAAFLAACGDGNIGGITGTGGGTTGGTTNPPSPPQPGGLVVNLSNFPALGADGGMARVDGNTSTPIAVTRVSASSYLAFSMVCPHAGFKPINIVAGSGYKCPNHGATFSSTGTWVGGQRTGNLNQYTVVYNQGAGTLTIT